MNFSEIIRMALSALRTNKLRSALTILGVTIGVLRKLVKQGVIKKHEVTVAYITGNGLKTQEAVLEAVGRPTRIHPSLVSFEKTFKVGKHGGDA